MRDFEWNKSLWCVVKDDGTFAGIPCTSFDEARELSIQHPGSRVFDMFLSDAINILEDDALSLDEYYHDHDEYYDPNLEMGFNPYEGCYDYDC